MPTKSPACTPITIPTPVPIQMLITTAAQMAATTRPGKCHPLIHTNTNISPQRSELYVDSVVLPARLGVLVVSVSEPALPSCPWPPPYRTRHGRAGSTVPSRPPRLLDSSTRTDSPKTLTFRRRCPILTRPASLPRCASTIPSRQRADSSATTNGKTQVQPCSRRLPRLLRLSSTTSCSACHTLRTCWIRHRATRRETRQRWMHQSSRATCRGT
ncbi:hypothetical protein BC831DRAFT_282274 [Entophlyctis helioformis]|nr:hypothetical protein BC831DRAFT_282274 [Entophlyctis helioformis]